MTAISAVSPDIQSQITNAISFSKDLMGTTASISNPSNFANDFMATLQRVAPSATNSSSLLGQSGNVSNSVSGSNKIGESIETLIKSVNEKQQEADVETKKVLSGESDNLHQSVIKMQEANVAFSLMIEVRNKLMESYQELMRTSV